MLALDIDPIRELYLYLQEVKANPHYFKGSPEQLKHLSTLSDLLRQRRGDEAFAVFNKIERSTWEQFTNSSYLRKDFDTYLYDLLLKQEKRSTAQASIELELSAKDFYIVENPRMSTVVVDAHLNSIDRYQMKPIYNEIREALEFIEQHKRVLKEEEILQQLQRKYSYSSWWRSCENMPSIMKTVIHKKDLLYKHPEKLLKYLEKLETIPMPLQTRRALQTNLLARTNNLRFFVQETFAGKTILLQPKIFKTRTNSRLLRRFPFLFLAFITVGAVELATATGASAEDRALLERLHNNFGIFTDANDDTIKYIQQNKFSAEYCRQNAQALHEAVADPSLVPITSQLMQELQQEQGDEIQNNIIKNLRQLNRAY